MGTMEKKSRYNKLDPVLHKINQHISLNDEETKRNAAILNEITEKVITKIRRDNVLFNYLFRRVFYGGSYYDQLKVLKPEEYDLDLLLDLPKVTNPIVTRSDEYPGHVKVKLNGLGKFLEQRDFAAIHKELPKLLNDNDELDVEKVLRWVQSNVSKGIQNLDFTTSYGLFTVTIHQNGPAFTLVIKNGTIFMEVDFVICFVFNGSKWPADIKSNPVKNKDEFFVVPKPLKVAGCSNLWRLSFQEQERELFKQKEHWKPTVRLLKQLRDKYQHKIASYYIKTLLLWELNNRDFDFWMKNSLGCVFMTSLKQYRDCLENGEIPYFWDEDKNLIEDLDKITLFNIKNCISYIIKDIERHLDDDINRVAMYLLPPDAYTALFGVPIPEPEAEFPSETKSWCSIM